MDNRWDPDHNSAMVRDNLQEIFRQLPFKCLYKFSCVCRKWHDLILSPEFLRGMMPDPNPAVGLFYRALCPLIGTMRTEYTLLRPSQESPNPPPPPTQQHIFVQNFWGKILNSCNGLLMCYWPCSPLPLAVYNVTTSHIDMLNIPYVLSEHLSVPDIAGVSIVFDPTKSHHYKIVTVRVHLNIPSCNYEFEVYSSENRLWRPTGVTTFEAATFFNGVYWNGNVHWICENRKESMCFKVEEERLDTMPGVPVMGDPFWELSRWRENYYFGESCGHLYLIPIGCWQLVFNVYEMKTDYSEWFFKYEINIVDSPYVFENHHDFHVFALIGGREDKDAFLVIRFRGFVARFNIEKRTFEELSEFENDDENDGYVEGEETKIGHYLKVRGSSAYQHNELPTPLPLPTM